MYAETGISVMIVTLFRYQLYVYVFGNPTGKTQNKIPENCSGLCAV